MYFDEDDTWRKYKNGNYDVFVDLKTGTKIRINNTNTLEPEMPESADVNITDFCDRGCPYCYRGCTERGKHADILNEKLFNTMHPWMEIALGGGNVLAHPDLDKFLERCQERRLIPSITVNQVHFMKDLDRLKKFRDEHLIYGIGVSVTDPTDELIESIKQFPNAVIHLIAGITPLSVFKKLSYHGLKILILGYKDVGFGKDFLNHNPNTVDMKLTWLKTFAPSLLSNGWFTVVSFDNLALKQLDVKNHVPKEWWDRYYMGDDGIDGDLTSASMYIDLVSQTYSRNSFSGEKYTIDEPDVNTLFERLIGNEHERQD